MTQSCTSQLEFFFTVLLVGELGLGSVQYHIISYHKYNIQNIIKYRI